MPYILHVTYLLCIPASVDGEDRWGLTESQLLLKQMVLNSVTAPNTRRSYARALDDLFVFTARRALTRALLQEWKASMNGLAASTVNVKLAAARRLVSEARRNGLIGAEEASNLSDIPNVARRGNRMREFSPYLHLDGKAVGFLVAAALPWFIDSLDSFKGFGFELKRRLDEQSAAIQEQQKLLNLMFWFSMEADMFDTLKSLVEADTFTHNPLDNAVYPIVNAHLKEPFNKSYISREPASIEQDENIGGGRIVTELGKRFVGERERLEAEGGRSQLQRLSPLS